MFRYNTSLTKAKPSFAPPRSVQPRRNFADFKDREQGVENVDVKKHDAELLKKLREQGGAANKVII
jgi:hypothetical protein